VQLVDSIPNEGVARTVPLDPRDIDGEINLDFDGAGHLIGIEVLDASRFLTSETLGRAE
jgi:uncharacterized protein YuzE